MIFLAKEKSSKTENLQQNLLLAIFFVCGKMVKTDRQNN
jgi:hypothetical protein